MGALCTLLAALVTVEQQSGRAATMGLLLTYALQVCAWLCAARYVLSAIDACCCARSLMWCCVLCQLLKSVVCVRPSSCTIVVAFATERLAVVFTNSMFAKTLVACLHLWPFCMSCVHCSNCVRRFLTQATQYLLPALFVHPDHRCHEYDAARGQYGGADVQRCGACAGASICLMHSSSCVPPLMLTY
jgi:hypothetical protein